MCHTGNMHQGDRKRDLILSNTKQNSNLSESREYMSLSEDASLSIGRRLAGADKKHTVFK